MLTLDINGKKTRADAEPDTPLLWVLRDTIKLTGTKYGCGMALCGACTVHMNGEAVRSCITPVSAAVGKKIVTIESVGSDRVGRAVQDVWRRLDVVQCGYCQSGQIMSAAALLAKTTRPTDAQIDDAMSGNVCRCGTYNHIRKAIKRAAQLQAGGSRSAIIEENAPVESAENAVDALVGGAE
jgi:isoquinoline 1-oxidoreductase alpha subunit